MARDAGDHEMALLALKGVGELKLLVVHRCRPRTLSLPRAVHSKSPHEKVLVPQGQQAQGETQGRAQPLDARAQFSAWRKEQTVFLDSIFAKSLAIDGFSATHKTRLTMVHLAPAALGRSVENARRTLRRLLPVARPEPSALVSGANSLWEGRALRMIVSFPHPQLRQTLASCDLLRSSRRLVHAHLLQATHLLALANAESSCTKDTGGAEARCGSTNSSRTTGSGAAPAATVRD